MNEYIKLGIWIAVFAVIFAFLWRKGYLLRIRIFVAETREELRKCTWPSKQELKGSTVVVLITTALIGLYTVGIDFIVAEFIQLIT